MQVIGETGANKVIADYSGQFQRDFIQLLRTSHNTKAVHINHFYQQMIADKSHIHMVCCLLFEMYLTMPQLINLIVEFHQMALPHGIRQTSRSGRYMPCRRERRRRHIHRLDRQLSRSLAATRSHQEKRATRQRRRRARAEADPGTNSTSGDDSP